MRVDLWRPWTHDDLDHDVSPRYVLPLAGRAVRPKSVIMARHGGFRGAMLIWTVGFWDVWTGGRPGPMASPFWAAVFTICYAPLNLWGPGLLALTWAYHRRQNAARIEPEAKQV